MAYMEYATKINAPIEKVWKALCDVKNPQITDGIAARIEMEPLAKGSWIGIERVAERGGGWYEEIFTDVDNEKFRIAWIISDAGPIPITDYDCVIQLTPAGKEACHVGFEARFKPVDVSEQAIATGFISGWMLFCANARKMLGC